MWTTDYWDIQRLRMMVLNSWDRQAQRNTVDAIASYGKPALSTLTDLATWTWDEEFRSHVLNKIKDVNENRA